VDVEKIRRRFLFIILKFESNTHALDRIEEDME
jgi:hypothetical protein